MKKYISLLMALAMLTLCACGQGGQQNGDATDGADDGAATAGLYQEISGIAADETVMTVAGNEIPADLFCYMVDYNCTNLSNELLTYYLYYGAYAECVNEDQSINWDGMFYTDTTLGQYARNLTENSLTFYTTVENLAAELGVTLTEEDLAAVEESFAATAEEQGGEEAFAQSLSSVGLRVDSYKRLITDWQLFLRLTEMVGQEGSALYLAPADYSQYRAYADHILLLTTDSTTGEALSEDEIAAKRATAEDLLAQLRAVEGEERETLFAQLADEYGEDPGRQTNPTGYIFGTGEMVAEFETAAFALQTGEVSDIVETSYGYHILFCRDLAEGIASDEEARTELFQEHLTDLIQLELEQAEVVLSPALEEFDLADFYTRYTDAVSALSADGEDYIESADGTDSTDGQ